MIKESTFNLHCKSQLPGICFQHQRRPQDWSGTRGDARNSRNKATYTCSVLKHSRWSRRRREWHGFMDTHVLCCLVYTEPDRKCRCGTLWDVGSARWATADCIWDNMWHSIPTSAHSIPTLTQNMGMLQDISKLQP